MRDFEDVSKRCADFIARKVKDAKTVGTVVGVSGGVDSAVALALSVKAVGGGKVLGLVMPSMTTPSEDTADALDLCDQFGARWAVQPINSIVLSFNPRGDRKSIGNLKARIRMCLLYLRANSENRLVVGTSDRSELALGYYTKFGDGGVDIEPIGGLYKTEVRKLALHLGIPKHIALKPSSPMLWDGHSAADEIGFDYAEIDRMLVGGKLPAALARMAERNAHKGRTPEVLKLD